MLQFVGYRLEFLFLMFVYISKEKKNKGLKPITSDVILGDQKKESKPNKKWKE